MYCQGKSGKIPEKRRALWFFKFKKGNFSREFKLFQYCVFPELFKRVINEHVLAYMIKYIDLRQRGFVAKISAATKLCELLSFIHRLIYYKLSSKRVHKFKIVGNKIFQFFTS